MKQQYFLWGLTLVQNRYRLLLTADCSSQTARVVDAHIGCWVAVHRADNTLLRHLVVIPVRNVTCLPATHRCSTKSSDVLPRDMSEAVGTEINTRGFQSVSLFKLARLVHLPVAGSLDRLTWVSQGQSS